MCFCTSADWNGKFSHYGRVGSLFNSEGVINMVEDKKKDTGETDNTNLDTWDIPTIPNSPIGESKGEENFPRERPKKNAE